MIAKKIRKENSRSFERRVGRSKIREGVVIKVLQETRSRLIEAKKTLGHGTYDSLFNWLLEQAGQ